MYTHTHIGPVFVWMCVCFVWMCVCVRIHVHTHTILHVAVECDQHGLSVSVCVCARTCAYVFIYTIIPCSWTRFRPCLCVGVGVCKFIHARTLSYTYKSKEIGRVDVCALVGPIRPIPLPCCRETQNVSVCCRVLPCAAVCCRVLQCVVSCCSVPSL